MTKQYVLVIDYDRARQVVKRAYNGLVIKTLKELLGEEKFNELKQSVEKYVMKFTP